MNSLRFSWIVALIATCGSLYFSEVKNFIPCTLCWYQRIFMYPLVILLGIAVFKDDKKIIPYLLPMTIIGGSISVYHYLEQKLPHFSGFIQCKVGIPCSAEYINWFGFITIPFLALIAFTFITISLFIGLKKAKNID